MDLDRTTLRLIDLLYQGLEDRAALDVFTEELAASLYANAVALAFEPDEDRFVPTSTFGGDAHYLRQFAEYYHALNVHELYTTIRTTPCLGEPVSTEHTCPARALFASEYYNDFLRPQKLAHVIGTILHVGPEGTANLAIYPAPHATVASYELATPLIRALAPHLQRVNRVLTRMGTGAAAAEALERFDTAVVVVSASGKIIFANPAAEQIFQRSDGLCCLNAHLRASHPEYDIQLAEAIRSACVTEGGEAVFPVARRSQSRAYQVTVERFLGKSSGVHVHAAIVFITDPASAPQISEKPLARFFGLTRAEARLCNLLLQGNELTEACNAVRITRNTGRAHLRSIFNKVGVKSQNQLIAVLSRSLARKSVIAKN